MLFVGALGLQLGGLRGAALPVALPLKGDLRVPGLRTQTERRSDWAPVVELGANQIPCSSR